MMRRVRAARICVHLCSSASKFSLVRGANSGGEVSGEVLDDADGFDADADDLTDEQNDVVGVVFTVGVGFSFDLILADDPFERGA